jgi:hypothetical protein
LVPNFFFIGQDISDRQHLPNEKKKLKHTKKIREKKYSLLSPFDQNLGYGYAELIIIIISTGI